MKNNKWLVLAGAVALTAFSTAQAVQITGNVDMSGTTTLNNVNLSLASSAGLFSSVTVGGIPTGSFALNGGSLGQAVTWTGFSWPSSTLVSPLWTFSTIGGSETFSFALANDSVVTQTSSFLNLLGNGTLTGTGAVNYDPTPGVWSFTISNPSGQTSANMSFTFQNSQTAVIPDGGATVMLLGAALSAMGLFRKKLIA